MPPAMGDGPNIAAPSADSTWLPGSWIWHENRYVWRPGFWAGVQPNWVWVPDHYVWAPRGYVFVNGRNYSVLVVQARLSAETVTFYGDNGRPAEAADVVAAARTAGPLPFEPPHAFRGRMRELSKWMKEKGLEAEQ